MTRIPMVTIAGKKQRIKRKKLSLALVDQVENAARVTSLRTFSDQIFQTTLAPKSKENFGKQAAPAAFTIYGHFNTGRSKFNF